MLAVHTHGRVRGSGRMRDFFFFQPRDSPYSYEPPVGGCNRCRWRSGAADRYVSWRRPCATHGQSAPSDCGQPAYAGCGTDPDEKRRSGSAEVKNFFTRKKLHARSLQSGYTFVEVKNKKRLTEVANWPAGWQGRPLALVYDEKSRRKGTVISQPGNARAALGDTAV